MAGWFQTGVRVASAGLIFAHSAQAQSQDEMQRSWDGLVYNLRNWGIPRHPPFRFEVSRTSDNAAARYLWLFQHMDPRSVTLAGYLDTSAAAFSLYENDDGLTADDLRRALSEAQPWILSFIEATRLPTYDMGFSDDPLAVPEFDDPRRQVSGRRKAARVLIADACRLWHDNRPVESAERFAACIRFGRHLSAGTASMLDALIAQAIIRYAADALHTLLESPELARMTPAAAEIILPALASVGTQDPGGVRRAANNFRRGMAAFVESQLAGGHVGFQLKRLLSESRMLQSAFSGLLGRMISGQNAGEAIRGSFRVQFSEALGVSNEVESLSHADLVAALVKARTLADDADRAWDLPDATDRLRQLDDAADEDHTGVAGLIVIGIRASYRSTRECAESLAAIQECLQTIIAARSSEPPRRDVP
jgi:hypothetical protein